MLSPREVSDRLEIAERIQLYFRAMDTWDYALLDAVFTPDAVMHYEMTKGGAKTTYRAMLPSFREFNRRFSFMQHVGAQLLVETRGDEASAGHNLRALHVQTALDGHENRWAVYGVYRDQLVRTPEGWRIRERHFRAQRIEGQLLPPEQVRAYERPPWL
jgi:ketosteroid isomerase-like protein